METMTSGSAYRHLWRYALPLILGNWLQLAYNAADSVIAGRFLGAQALAAEGAAAPVMNLVILGISGVTVGAGVLMSEFFGAGKQGLLRRTLASHARLALAWPRLARRYRGAMPRRTRAEAWIPLFEGACASPAADRRRGPWTPEPTP